jgi:hypothetical protein
MILSDLGTELHDLAVAIGLLDGDGSLRTAWFANPLGQAGTLFHDPDRRAALSDLIDLLAPADPTAPTEPDGTETWHSLAGAGTAHEVLLIRRTVTGGGLALGLAVRGGTAKPGVALTFAVDLVQADDSGLHSIVGASGNPVRVRVEVSVDPAAGAGFDGLVIEAELSPADASAPVTLQVGVLGLRVGDQVLPTVFLDPRQLGRDAVPLVQNLLQARLRGLALDPGSPAELAALADHILPLAGLGSDVPRLPVERVGIDPAVVAGWFASVIDAPGTAEAWLAHLAGLFGADTTPAGTGTETDPWRIPLAGLGDDGGIELTIGVRTTAAGREVLAGFSLHLAGPAGLGVDASVVLIALPLSGPEPARAVPSAVVVVRAPGNPAATLVDSDELRIGFAQAGLAWDGTTLRPVLELGQVLFEGAAHDLIDLSNADSVRAAAAQAARDAIMGALGNGGPGAHLAVLAGLVPPAGENGAPVADLVALLSAPTRELARVHRARLLDPAHSWAPMLAELAGLLGLSGAVAGSGTAADPWRVTVGQAAPLELELAAWTEASADGPVLHLGPRVAVSATAGPATIAATGLGEVVRLIFPASGPVTSKLLGQQSAHLSVTGPFTLAAVQGIGVQGIGLSLQGLDAGIDWSTGQPLTPVVTLTGFTLHVDGTDITIPALQVPPAAGFDPGKPDLGLGLDVASLDRVARALLAQLWGSAAGPDGVLASALLGLHDGLSDLPSDWPVPELGPGGVGGLLDDPLGALRDWLSRVVLNVSQDSMPFAVTALTQLHRLTSTDDGGDAGLEGAGSYAAPWRVDLGGHSGGPGGGPGGSQLLVWLEPDGPAAGWAGTGAQAAIDQGSPDGLLAAMSEVGQQVPALTGLFGGPQGTSAPDRLTDALAALLRRCSDGDGVVPFLAQVPDDPAWTLADTSVDAAHHRLPEHADTIAQTLAQLGTWVPGPERAVLLIGPPFTGQHSWQPLLAAAEAAQPGATSDAAHFDLRTPPSPDLADLASVTVAASWYTADLADPGGDIGAVVAQVAAVVGRIRELRSGVPVVLVAHSTAGLAARAFAAANSAQLAGLITIGTPHSPADLTVLDDATQTDAVRLTARLLDAAQVTAPIRDVTDQLLAVAEGWQATSTLPARISYPRERFTGDISHDTGGVPALAIAGQLAADPATELGAALATVLTPAGLTPADGPGTPPSHLGIGLRVGLAGAVTAPGAVSVDAGLRVDVARVSLSAQPASLPDLAARARVEIRVDRPGGWLIDPPDGQGVRLRRAELGVTVESGSGAGPVSADATFFDAAIDSPTTPVVTLGDTGADRLLSAVADALATAGPGGTAVLDALIALGVATQDASGNPVVLADAVQRLRTDPGGYLGPRLRTALDSTPGQLGVQGSSGGPWTATAPALPLTFELATDRLTVRLTELDLAGAQLSAEVVRLFSDGTAQQTLALTWGSAALRFDPATGTLVLDTGLGDPVTLVPGPAATQLAGHLAPHLLELMITSVGAAALAGRLGPGWTLGPLAQLLVHPGQVLCPLLDGDRIGGLLQALSGLLAGLTAAAPAPGQQPGLALPGGLVLNASGQPGQLSLRTEPPLAVPGIDGGQPGSLTVELDIGLARTSGAPDVAATVNLTVPLGGTWGTVSVALGYAHGTVSLAITPTSAAGAALAPILLLPRFGGLGPLAADAASALLPAVLDALEARQPTPRPPLAEAIFAVADAIGVHGGASDPSFAAHTDALQALAGPGGLTALAATGLPAAVAQLWQVAGLPGTVTQAPSGVTVQSSTGPITATIELGWGSTPVARLRIDGLVAGPISFDQFVAGVSGDGTVTGELTAAIALPAAAEQLLGLHLAPALRIEAASGLTMTALPLGTAGADLIQASLLPAPGLTLGAGGIGTLLEQLVMPLAAQVGVDHLNLTTPLFSGGPTVVEVLRAAGILAADGLRLVVPLPPAGQLATQLLAALAGTGVTVPLGSDLALQLLADHSTTPARFGLGLNGSADLSDGDIDVSLRAGEPAPTWLPDPAPALRLLLIEDGTWRMVPELRLAPLGIRLAGSGGSDLLDTTDVHLGAVTGYLWATMDLDGGFSVSDIGGALDVDDLGLPLGAVTSGDATANPVAGSLLDSGSASGGDQQAVLPGVSLVAARRPGTDFTLLHRDGDTWVPLAAEPLWVPVNLAFGPLSVSQVGVAYLPGPTGSGQPGTAEIFLDGGVQVGPLTIAANELGVSVPLGQLDQPGSWPLDLAGLAVAFSNDSVSMAGGLVKRDGQPVDYAGTLTVEVAGRTFTAVGAYSMPTDQQGGFTSLFVFAGLPTVLGGPPYMFVTGLGAGGGYDRRLVPPAQVTDVEQFPLVTAIDQGNNADPMGTLELLGTAMVPQRGSYWLAAGIRFISFSFVRSVAVAYASLDRGADIGLVGVSRAAIPPPDAGPGSLELASVELALKARFSTTDGVLSVQSQLTDNSWLLSRDCQLTGGFAFFMWFHQDQFVLTLGGYHPAFVRPPQFPVVPRLGFHWAVSDAIVVKGETYFALTSSSVMAGGRLEVSYNKAGIYASFTAYADFLIAWDPFHYDVMVGVSVTAGFRLRACFFVCVTIDVSVSIGASVHLLGPPLHGEVTVDLEVASITIAFGPAPHAPLPFLDWDAFRDKYVVAGAPDGSALSVHASAGLIPPDAVPAVSGPALSAPGSQGNPWRVTGTFSLRTETRLAATAFSVNGVGQNVTLNDGVPAALDLAPMNVAHVSGVHDLSLRSAANSQLVDMSHLDVEPVVGHVPAAVWQITDQPVASAAVIPVLTGLTITGSPTVADDGGRPPISLDVIDFNPQPVPIGLLSSPAPAMAGPPAATATATATARSMPGRRPLNSRRSAPPVMAPLNAGLRTPAAAAPAPAPAAPVTTAPLTTAPPPTTPLASARAAAPRPIAVLHLSHHTDRPKTPLTRAAHTGRVRFPAANGPGSPGAGSLADGIRLEPGVLRVWDLPPTGDPGRWLVSGPGTARVVFLDRAGYPLLDDEVGAGQQVTAPPGAARVVISAVGRSPEAGRSGDGTPRVCGWKSGSLLVQVAPATLLASGATVHLASPLATRRDGRRTSQALVHAARAVASQPSCTTCLPASVDLVLVIVDGTGQPEVSLDGAPAGQPVVITAGARRYLLYPATGSEAGRPLIRVRVQAAPDCDLAGVLGLPGDLDQWAQALDRGATPQLAPEQLASPPAPVTIRHEIPTTTPGEAS